MKIGISGAGIAGTTLAYWLARAGHVPTLIEQAPHLRTGGYVIDFWGVGYTVAERMGILPAIREAGYSVREVRFVDGRGRKVGGFPVEIFGRIAAGRFTSLPRGDLAEAIYRSLAGGVEILFGNSISALEEHATGIRASFEHGEPRDFDLVIGADGLHSVVRELTFGPERQFERQLGCQVAAFEIPGYRPRDELVYVSYALPGRQIARFSLRGDRTMFLLIFYDEYLPGPLPHDLAERKAVLRQVFGHGGWECPQILQGLDAVEEVYFDRVSQIHLPAWSQGRVLLVGDAAACVSLLAGEGSGLAMTAAYVLAGELQHAAGDYAAAFRRHEQRLRPFIEGKQKSARNFVSSFAPRTQRGIWFRNQVTKLLAFPPLAHYFIGRDLVDHFDLPDYGL